MRIATWNINGLRSGFEEVKNFLNENQIDVLALQEIKIHESDLTDAHRNIAGYQSFFNPADKKGYSGTAFYSKALPDAVRQGLGDPEIDGEGRMIEIEIGDFRLVNFYFPHSSRDLHRMDYKMNFNQKVLQFIEKNLDDRLILFGDFNVAHKEIDLARPKQNRSNAGFTEGERKFFDQFLNAGLVDIYRSKHPDKQEFTWWGHFYNMRDRNIGWRIDYFLATKNLAARVKKIEIANKVFGSDHCPVIIELQEKNC